MPEKMGALYVYKHLLVLCLVLQSVSSPPLQQLFQVIEVSEVELREAETKTTRVRVSTTTTVKDTSGCTAQLRIRLCRVEKRAAEVMPEVLPEERVWRLREVTSKIGTKKEHYIEK